jgi:hypothetical protein
MAPRFFFDVSTGVETIRDEIGAEAKDLDEALTEALDVLLDAADEMAEADPGRPWALLVRDEAGVVVGRLPIKR